MSNSFLEKSYLAYRKSFLMRMICLCLSTCFNTTFSDPSCPLKKIPSHFIHILFTQSRYKPVEEREPRDSAALGSQGASCSGNSYRRMLLSLKIHFCPSIRQHRIHVNQENHFLPAVLCCVPGLGLGQRHHSPQKTKPF